MFIVDSLEGVTSARYARIMFDTASRPLTRVDAAVEQLLTLTHAGDPWGGCSSAELMATLERVQQLANLAAAAEQSLLGHAIVEDTFESFGYTSPAELLVDRLHLDRTEAQLRVRRAKQNPPRTTLTGEALPPKYEVLADAQASGSVTGAHVDRVNHWLAKIEPHASLTRFADYERRLVDKACTANPDAVATVGREILHDLDPDGPAPRDLAKRRALRMKQRSDGSGSLDGSRLTPELLAMLQTLISPLAAPRPENAQTGERDTRGAMQRQHDGFEELLTRLLQSGDLPAHGGIPLTVVVMMDIDDLVTKTGTARTPFGTTIPVQRLLEQAAELQVVPVITSEVDGILAYGVSRRIASPGQALALIARDRGCTFPGCCRPAQWTQRHHVREAVDGGPTDLDNLVLVCGWHHRNFGKLGWTVELQDGRAWWTPPPTVDPDRQPIRNETHHPAAA